MIKTEPTLKQIQDCIQTLTQIEDNQDSLSLLTEPERIQLLKSAGRLSRPDRVQLKKRQKAIHLQKRIDLKNEDRQIRSKTGIREARKTPVFIAPAPLPYSKSNADSDPSIESNNGQQDFSPGELRHPRRCYVCNSEFTKLHHFYDAMCSPCGDLNYQKRFQKTSLEGRIALITGSRVKIGYQATLTLLRAGARVLATTRFPVDSALRFSKETDFKEWSHRLEIFGLDLRHTPSVEIFTAYLSEYLPRLDILINNAAQTVRRPPGFYSHLMANESTNIETLPASLRSLLIPYENCKKQIQSQTRGASCSLTQPQVWSNLQPEVGLVSPSHLSLLPYSFDLTPEIQMAFPSGQLDADLQQVDLRETNSWRLKLGEISTAELLEVQLVNAVAPFVLCGKLAPLMRRDFTGEKHIVNVTAMEGKFYRFTKPDRHPHTNMAKAALNMLTHTSASDLARDGIFMNAVDTGWVTDEDPAALSAKNQKLHDFQPPLDIVDGAARVCDPFFNGILTGHHVWGQFLKDYHSIDW